MIMCQNCNDEQLLCIPIDSNYLIVESEVKENSFLRLNFFESNFFIGSKDKYKPEYNYRHGVFPIQHGLNGLYSIYSLCPNSNTYLMRFCLECFYDYLFQLSTTLMKSYT